MTRNDFQRWAWIPAVFALLILTTACAPIRQEVNPGRGGYRASGYKGPLGKTNASQNKLPGGSVQKPDAWKDELEGIASWYGVDFNGRLTASGEVYDMYEMTAAHKTLPLGTVVKVHNLDNGKTVTVKVNDRGPYVAGRVIDLSRKAARALGMREDGTAHVRLEVKSMPSD
jgi:rare lipoprotein A (peptidoglycan hydrolase)